MSKIEKAALTRVQLAGDVGDGNYEHDSISDAMDFLKDINKRLNQVNATIKDVKRRKQGKKGLFSRINKKDYNAPGTDRAQYHYNSLSKMLGVCMKSIKSINKHGMTIEQDIQKLMNSL